MKIMIFTLVFCLFSSVSVAQLSKQDTNKLTNTRVKTSPKSSLKIEYVVPGNVAIAAAKRYGFEFDASNPMNAAMRANCKQEGYHWTAKENWCFLTGFYHSGPGRCKILKEGWTIKEIVLSGGPVTWEVRPRNSNYPFFRVKTMANGKRVNTYTIKQVKMMGPEGPFKSFEEAFKRCA
ncbi:hypothetical protein BK026_05970 [Alteromonas sp. V450]|uniref:hypothetical protein n=1 Tax=Alteromonas sp. V450 TaxID=1912139 RepID=UPI0008FF36FB|nr:hypothetical protein [Alteromonas sp. V450]OJF68370.1 hypothetical protein BK026_05970 [Alteromonas sp. V450]